MGQPSRHSLSPAKQSAIRVILFDCDGVICPPMRFAKLLKENYGISREITAEFFSRTFNPALVGKANVLELLAPYLPQWGWTGTREEFLSEWLTSEKGTSAEVVKLVQELKGAGYRVGLATNQEKNRASYMRKEMGFQELFHHCFISCELGNMKPEHAYFEKITKILDVSPSEIVFVDDQQHYLDAALQIGWHAILFTDIDELRPRLASMLATSNGKPDRELPAAKKEEDWK